jgi:hypothetical protein
MTTSPPPTATAKRPASPLSESEPQSANKRAREDRGDDSALIDKPNGEVNGGGAEAEKPVGKMDDVEMKA